MAPSSRMHLLYKASSLQGSNLIDYEIRVYGGPRRATAFAMNNGAKRRMDGTEERRSTEISCVPPRDGTGINTCCREFTMPWKSNICRSGACCCVGGPGQMFWQPPGNPFDYSFVRVAIACTNRWRNQSRPRKPAGFIPNPPDSSYCRQSRTRCPSRHVRANFAPARCDCGAKKRV